MYTLVSPWPPQRNGIADYAQAIARHTESPLQVMTEALRPAQAPAQANEAIRFLTEAEFLDAQRRRCVPAVYHFGNNPDHAFMVPLFLRRPGVAVVHDLSLQYLVQQTEPLLPGIFAAELRAEHPQLAGDMTALWAQPGMKRGMDDHEVKLLGWLRAAPAIVVHSHYAERIVRGWLPGKPVHVVPHFCYLPGLSEPALRRVRDERRVHWATKAGLDPSRGLIVSALGFASRSKQYAAALSAIATLPDALRGRVRFLIAGAERPREYDLAGDIARSGMAEQVRLLGYLSVEEMDDLLLASDLVLNLRYPTFGESSGVLARALGLGCAVVVTDQGSYAELPDEACIKLPARPDPGAALRVLLTEALDDRTRLEARRSAAYAHAHTTGDPRLAAARYAEIAHGG